jgi:hypothetical protein
LYEGVDQGRIQVDQQHVAIGHLPTSGDASQIVRIPGNPLGHAPSGRGLGDTAEQLRLLPQHHKSAEAVTTVG